jgi:glycosyltransferase involved in cell wall biosynthesis
MADDTTTNPPEAEVSERASTDFIRAAALLRAAPQPRLTFALLGAGPLRQGLELRARRQGLTAERFRFLGHVENMERLYPAFDILVLSSLYEGLPYVLLEAMAWGLPIVATDVLGSRELIVDGQSGLLAAPGDPASLAAGVRQLLEDPALRRALGDTARRQVRERFPLTEFLAAHDRLYRRRLVGAAPPERVDGGGACGSL